MRKFCVVHFNNFILRGASTHFTAILRRGAGLVHRYCGTVQNDGESLSEISRLTQVATEDEWLKMD